MAVKFKKGLKTITVKTIGGATITASDTVDAPVASNALAEFEAFQTMHIKGENKVTEVPFHAVDNIEVTTALSEEQTRKDPYCVEETPEP